MKCHPELDSGSIKMTMKAIIQKEIDAETSSA